MQANHFFLQKISNWHLNSLDSVLIFEPERSHQSSFQLDLQTAFNNIIESMCMDEFEDCFLPCQESWGCTKTFGPSRVPFKVEGSVEKAQKVEELIVHPG